PGAAAGIAVAAGPGATGSGITGAGTDAATARCAGGAGAGTERGAIGVVAAEKMLLSATAALAAAVGVGAGVPLGFSRWFTRAVRSLGWDGLCRSLTAFSAHTPT